MLPRRLPPPTPSPSKSSIPPKGSLTDPELFFAGEEENEATLAAPPPAPEFFSGDSIEWATGEEKKSLARGAPGVAIGIDAEV